MWLRPQITHLCVDIFVDDGGSYLRHNHDLLLFARNGYTKQVNEFIPFSVSMQPAILDKTIRIALTSDKIIEIENFIKTNLSSLQSLAKRELSQPAFVESLNNKE